MKLILLLFTFPLCLSAYSQHDSAFEKNAWYLNTGFSFGYYRYELSGARDVKILPTTVSLEKALSDQFSIGTYLGYAKWEYLNDFNLEFISVGGRVSWHLLPVLIDWVDLDLDPSRWDLYLSGIVGYEYRVADELFGSIGPDGKKGKVIYGPVAGIRYFFNPRLGFFAEGGKGAFGYGTAGISFKF
jgi:hypothetical protein